MKQERRGGIETGHGWGARGALDGKQERRGGIETDTTEAIALETKGEAGTPWWH